MKLSLLATIAVVVFATAACAQSPKPAWVPLNTKAQEASAITWQSVPHFTPGTAEVEKHWTMHEGDGTRSRAYETIMFVGKTNLPPGTPLYAFFAKDEEGQAAVNGFLVSKRPGEWSAVRKDPVWGNVVRKRDNFLEEHVLDDGTVIFRLDSYISKECAQFTRLTVADSSGTILNQLMMAGR